MNLGSLLFLVAVFVLLWLLMIRPQRAKMQQQQRMVDAIAPGDEVLTVGGLYGIVDELDEEGDLVVEVAEGIRVRIARRAVATVVKPDEAAADDDEAVEGEIVDEPNDEASVAREDAVNPEPAHDATASERR